MAPERTKQLNTRHSQTEVLRFHQRIIQWQVPDPGIGADRHQKHRGQEHEALSLRAQGFWGIEVAGWFLCTRYPWSASRMQPLDQQM